MAGSYWSKHTEAPHPHLKGGTTAGTFGILSEKVKDFNDDLAVEMLEAYI